MRYTHNILTDLVLGTVVIILAFICMRPCTCNSTDKVRVSEHKIYIHDTGLHVLKMPSKNIVQWRLAHDTFYKLLTVHDRDSLAAQYYDTNISQSVYKDSNISMHRVDTISRNRLLGSEMQYRLLKPQLIYESQTIERRKPSIEGGLGSYWLTGTDAHVMLDAWLVNKHHVVYRVGYLPEKHAIAVGIGIKW